MGWHEGLRYSLVGTADQVAAVVAAAEAFWSLRDPQLEVTGDKRAVLLDGHYPAMAESAANSTWTPSAGRVVRGLVYPWVYYGFEDRCPVSFAFMRNEPLTVGSTASWRLVTPRPLVDSRVREPLAATYGSLWREERPGSDWPWVETWEDEAVVRPGTPIVYRDGCDVRQRKVFPNQMAYCLAAVQHLTGQAVAADPDPSASVARLREGRELMARVLSAIHQSAVASRRAYWQTIFRSD